ncbi:MAG: Chemotaxis protein CheY [Smithella sp. PtaU1.Bin162]|jgi:two-component system chemotaxis response regulator CheY|nr:MAG: Chemotaxis protein CheY [Smithella sp. PtaU1.Bin162]
MNKDISVLIADDNEMMCSLIRIMLEKNGFKNIIEVHDGTSAFNTIKARKIDLIIADWHMEGISGIELLQKVRADEKISGTPFIIVSVEGLDVSIDKAFQYGVDEFISKPFRMEVFMEKITKVMEKSS